MKSKSTALQIISDEDMIEQVGIMRMVLGLKPGVPDEVIKATVLLAMQYGLSASNREIQIIPTGRMQVEGKWVDVYQPYVGVGGLTRSARRQSHFTHTETMLEEGELRELRGNLYDDMDVGVKITLWRLDVAKECKAAGIPYSPTMAVGLWRVKAQYRKAYKEKEAYYIPDSIPNTMSRKSKAAQRGLRAAIKVAYDLGIPDELLEGVAGKPEEAISLDDSEAVDGVAVLITEDMSELIDYYGLATVNDMDDDQQQIAITKLRMTREALADFETLSPDEKAKRVAQNADELGMGQAKPKRLGDNDDDPLPPTHNTAKISDWSQTAIARPPKEESEELEIIDAEVIEEEPEEEEERPYPADWPKEALLQFPNAFNDLEHARAEFQKVMKKYGSKGRPRAWKEWETVTLKLNSRKV